MRPKEIKKLIELIEQSNINELEVSRWGKKVRITKSANSHGITIAKPETIAITSPSPVPIAQEAVAPPETVPVIKPDMPQPKPAPDSEKIIEVRSPMVGTFYRAPSPDIDPYVQVGDIVTQNQVLCIIEAMKLMNEIESEWRGRIVEILVENARPVEYNQILFRIEKL